MAPSPSRFEGELPAGDREVAPLRPRTSAPTTSPSTPAAFSVQAFCPTRSRATAPRAVSVPPPSAARIPSLRTARRSPAKLPADRVDADPDDRRSRPLSAPSKRGSRTVPETVAVVSRAPRTLGSDWISARSPSASGSATRSRSVPARAPSARCARRHSRRCRCPARPRRRRCRRRRHSGRCPSIAPVARRGVATSRRRAARPQRVQRAGELRLAVERRRRQILRVGTGEAQRQPLPRDRRGRGEGARRSRACRCPTPCRRNPSAPPPTPSRARPPSAPWR